MVRRQANQTIWDSRDPEYIEPPELEEDEDLPYWVKFEQACGHEEDQYDQ